MMTFEEMLERAAEDRAEGYWDGRNANSPAPGSNRTASYRHGFECARADRRNEPAFGSAAAARAHCDEAELIDYPALRMVSA